MTSFWDRTASSDKVAKTSHHKSEIPPDLYLLSVLLRDDLLPRSMLPFLERLYSSMSPYTSCRIFSTDGTRDPGMSLLTPLSQSSLWSEHGPWMTMVTRCEFMPIYYPREYQTDISKRRPFLHATPLHSSSHLPSLWSRWMDHCRPPPTASPPDITHCTLTFAEIVTSDDTDNNTATGSSSTTCATEGDGGGGGGHRGEGDGVFVEVDGETDGGGRRRQRRGGRSAVSRGERAGSPSNLPP